MTGQSRSNAVSQWFARRLFNPLQGVTFSRWHRLLTGNGFSVHREFLPRAVLIGLASISNSVQSRIERRLFGDRIDAADVRMPLFVLGHYRSGTTHLHNLLSLDRRLASPNYYQVSFPGSFLVSEKVGARLGAGLTMRKRPHDNVTLSLTSPAEDELAHCAETLLSPHMCWHFPDHDARFRRYVAFRRVRLSERETWKRSLLRFARKLSVRYDRPLVFKSPCHTARIRLILDAFPDARFVHIHRHPLEVFQSTRHMEVAVTPFFQLQRRDLSTLDEFVLWRYREMYGAFLEDRRLIPDGRIAEIAYSRMTRDPVGSLRYLYEALDLGDFDDARPAVERYLSRINGYRNNVYGPLDGRVRRRVVAAWARYFDEWRYPVGA